MKSPSIGILAIGMVGLAAAVLVAIGPPSSHVAPPPAPPPPPAMPSVSAGGFSLTSVSAELPVDEARYPDGPHADVVNANCASCHSPAMVLSQPALSAEQWRAEVTKMREAYKAPVAEADVPAIVTYLAALSAAKPGATNGKAQDPDPKASPRVTGGGPG